MAIDTTPKTRGEPSIQSLASGLGTLGRYGDNYMVHAAEGETFVPKEILDANPNLKSALFQQMKMMGIEDPNRYVVGDALNSINPITGQPEFFFKKLWSKVKKVVKSIAPVVAPIIGNMILPGIGGLLAAGLTTKISGGSWGDALKSMATTYAVQGVASGFAGKGGFSMDKMARGFQTPFKALGDLPGSYEQGILGGRGYTELLPQYQENYTPPSETPLLDTYKNTPEGKAILNRQAQDSFSSNDDFLSGLEPPPAPPPPLQNQNLINVRGEMVRPRINQMSDIGTGTFRPVGTADGFVGTQQDLSRDFSFENDFPRYADNKIPYSPPEVRNYLNQEGLLTQRQIKTLGGNPMEGSIEQIGAYNERRGLTPEYVAELRNEANIAAQAKRYGIPPDPTEITFGQGAQEATNTGGILGEYITGPMTKVLTPVLGAENAGKYALPAALGLGVAAVSALSEEGAPTETSSARERSAYEEWTKIANKDSDQAIELYRRWYGQPQFTRADYEKRAGKNHGKPNWWFKDYGMSAAGGGEVMGPGTGTSDSIPARLSDGEFVMTARAVENAGGGDRSLGAARMYDMMNRFERGAA